MNALAYLIGAGSMSLGVEAAGFQVREVWETPGYGKNAQTWDLNRPEQKVNILELDWTSLHFQRYSEDSLDLLYGNPPCGGLSAMTCSRIGSPTNNCMRQWIRMVVHARPRMIMMENAYQLATDRIKPLLDDLTGVLDEHGYWWWTWMFYSYQIGTPQIRRRMFLCASLDQPVRGDLLELDDLPRAGDKTACPAGPYLDDLVGVEPSPHPVTTRTGAVVTQHYYDSEEHHRRAELIKAHRHRLGKPYLTQKEVDKLLAKAQASGDPADWALYERDKVHLWPDCPREFHGMAMHRPSVLTMDKAAPAIIGAYKFVHPVDDRFLTMREMARLMGYPDTWQFHQLRPHLIAQGIPVNSAAWCADRMCKVIGLR